MIFAALWRRPAGGSGPRIFMVDFGRLIPSRMIVLCISFILHISDYVVHEVL